MFEARVRYRWGVLSDSRHVTLSVGSGCAGSAWAVRMLTQHGAVPGLRPLHHKTQNKSCNKAGKTTAKTDTHNSKPMKTPENRPKYPPWLSRGQALLRPLSGDLMRPFLLTLVTATPGCFVFALCCLRRSWLCDPGWP